MNSGKHVVIGYWNARGLIQPIKLILEHLKIPYTVDIPKCGPAPYFSAEEFKHKKYESLKGFDFPNLPYFDDGERKLTHLFAIMEYIGLKNGLYPTEEGIIDCSLIREQIKDIMALETDYTYFYDHRKKGTIPRIIEKKESRLTYIKSVTPKIMELSRKFESMNQGINEVSQESSLEEGNSNWMLGKRITYIDFIVYEYLDHVRLLGVDCFPKNLSDFMTQFEKLPNIKEYIASERYMKYPLYTERSYIGRIFEDWNDHAEE